MKIFAKVFLALALFTSAAIAGDGHSGSGNRDGCTIDCPPPCTDSCPTESSAATDPEAGSLEGEASSESDESMAEYYLTRMWEMFYNSL